MSFRKVIRCAAEDAERARRPTRNSGAFLAATCRTAPVSTPRHIAGSARSASTVLPRVF